MRFAVFPDVIYAMPSLETVVLGDNRIEAIDATRLKTLPSLVTLDLSNNGALLSPLYFTRFLYAAELKNVPFELGLCTCIKYDCSLGGCAGKEWL